MDDNVLTDHRLRLVSRLVEADQDVDLLILPGAKQPFYNFENQVLGRIWDFLVRHLLTRAPQGHRLGLIQPWTTVLSRVFDDS